MTTALQRESEIKKGLVNQQRLVKSLLGGDKAKSDKFLATAVKVANDYKLRECHPQSIIDACINVAQMGLDLSPVLSHAYLVPFKKSVQLIVSARGYTAILSRTGWKVKSYIVNEADSFEYTIEGFTETVNFTKDLDDEEEVFKYAVALAESPDGGLYVKVMNKNKIDKHRRISNNQSGAKPSGVWAEWFDEMASKTVLKKLIKTLPIGEEMAKVLDGDDKPINAEIIEDKKPDDINDMLTRDIGNHDLDKETGELTEKKDLLDGVEVEKAQDTFNLDV